MDPLLRTDQALPNAIAYAMLFPLAFPFGFWLLAFGLHSRNLAK